ncbi:MAG: glutamate--tRNA ligase, partial [Candidatus Gribaldobacteria bacterium]|nr:glutamate--tRNA ligase [Candidatus Gribaldobacteria bacterium]
QDGYPEEAIIEYLLNLANSDFEDWRVENPEADNRQFVLRLEKINQSGALFDFVKLQDISKSLIAKMSTKEVTEATVLWAEKYDPSFAKIISSDKGYLERIFNIERGGDHQRKDIAKWSDVKNEFGCFYDEIFDNSSELLKQSLAGIDLILAQDFIKAFLEKYNHQDSQDEWFGKLKGIAVDFGFAPDLKTYKQNKEKYQGYVADVAKILRVFKNI